MVSLTISVTEGFKNRLRDLMWVNWSEVAREEALKKAIFERYVKTGEPSDRDWKFCEKIDWHPVDELPLKEEFIRKVEAAKKEKSIRVKSISDIFK